MRDVVRNRGVRVDECIGIGRLYFSEKHVHVQCDDRVHDERKDRYAAIVPDWYHRRATLELQLEAKHGPAAVARYVALAREHLCTVRDTNVAVCVERRTPQIVRASLESNALLCRKTPQQTEARIENTAAHAHAVAERSHCGQIVRRRARMANVVRAGKQARIAFG